MTTAWIRSVSGRAVSQGSRRQRMGFGVLIPFVPRSTRPRPLNFFFVSLSPFCLLPLSQTLVGVDFGVGRARCVFANHDGNGGHEGRLGTFLACYSRVPARQTGVSCPGVAMEFPGTGKRVTACRMAGCRRNRSCL